MYTIDNDILRVVINPAGAELSSLFNKTNGFEYLWSGDAKFWGKKSPVLFPIVGTLKGNQYFYDGKNYTLGRHGFAREKTFLVKEQHPESITFELDSDEKTLSVFPFPFSFSINYAINKNKLSVTYLVKNTAADTMYFSVGGHPAFKLPVADGLAYDDYFLLFNKTEHAGHWPISSDGLIETAPLPFLEDRDQIRLSKSLFYKDAIVLKSLRSDQVSVKSEKNPAGFSFSFKGFPYLGIWAAKDADFVCIEPWCGIADSVNSDQQLINKEGMIALAGGQNFERTWSVDTW